MHGILLELFVCRVFVGLDLLKWYRLRRNCFTLDPRLRGDDMVRWYHLRRGCFTLDPRLRGDDVVRWYHRQRGCLMLDTRAGGGDAVRWQVRVICVLVHFVCRVFIQELRVQ